MVAAVARHGYAETTVGELVALAGVSKSTFYEHFPSKQECFLATFETIVVEASRGSAIAYASQAGLEESLAPLRPLRRDRRRGDGRPPLVVVDSLSLGPGGARAARARPRLLRAHDPPELPERARATPSRPIWPCG